MKSLARVNEIKKESGSAVKIPFSKRAFGYIRLPMNGDPGGQYSLENQTDKIRDWALAHGMDIVRVFVDICNMETPRREREGLMELSQSIKPGDTMLMISIDRLVYSPQDYNSVYVDCKSRGLRIVGVNDALDTGNSVN